MLLPLTSAEEDDDSEEGRASFGFTGGGTACWSTADRGPERSRADSGAAPTFTLTPAAGTALLWGGDVTHAGLPVTSGVRTVFVASFSPHAVPWSMPWSC